MMNTELITFILTKASKTNRIITNTAATAGFSHHFIKESKLMVLVLHNLSGLSPSYPSQPQFYVPSRLAHHTRAVPGFPRYTSISLFPLPRNNLITFSTDLPYLTEDSF